MTTLEQLPERMERLESQIVQLRTEMRDEFSAVRQEIRVGDEETRRQLTELNEEARRHMRVHHEDVIGRLATIQEGQTNGRQRRRKRKDTDG